ncbi:sigma-70 family RNA polymerase sigma factor [Pedobacter sp. GR22-6]|uniref:sigma-70 family RNA polymerase sigma factor n=1 Tax=Pedobacter sp. GR22-6 TaxID=3127957 RepID=UPI00307E6FE3
MKNITFDNQLCSLRPKLKSFAYQFTQDLNDAEDLVQETFMKAIKYANLYQEGTNLQAWVFTIMRNTFINSYRQLTKRRTVVTVTDDLSSFQLRESASRNQGEGKFVQSDINLAMSTLPQENYVTFMRYFEGFKYHEIAEEMQIPIGTVKTRIHVARKLLKAKLKMYSDQFAPQNASYAQA